MQSYIESVRQYSDSPVTFLRHVRSPGWRICGCFVLESAAIVLQMADTLNGAQAIGPPMKVGLVIREHRLTADKY